MKTKLSSSYSQDFPYRLGMYIFSRVDWYPCKHLHDSYFNI